MPETPYQKLMGDLGMKIRDHRPVTEADFQGLKPADVEAFRRLQKEYSRAPAQAEKFTPKIIKRGPSGAEEVSGDFNNLVGDDDYLYHVTTKAKAAQILKGGLKPGGDPSMGEGFYRDYSRGKAFLSERGGVSYWKEKIGNHLESQSDNPSTLTVVRIPRGAVKGLNVDELGASDSGRGSYYISGDAMPETPATAKKLGPGATDAKALSDKLSQWRMTPDEAQAMNEKGWIKLAFDSGVKLPSKAVRKNAIFNLIKEQAGPAVTPQELFERFKAAGK